MPVLTLIALLLGPQIWDGGGKEPIVRPPASGIGPILGDTERRVRAGRRSGQLSRAQARGFRRDASVIEDLSDRYTVDGMLSDSENAELRARAEAQRGIVDAQRLSPPTPSPR
ncbi:hypothetical protein COC42_08165 [Sphingomonas spermidinifaciens]|uniref:Uncharacterized protein n=1 Tax=Sphingomonas spermidinifaciens TaxID=1141889 RepID=A0A2A4B848_9SPHN|nr:hypothetical protein [Sphingomonas spermidinifaciens]PCD04250.1 hypothetical protein COC42_08165 [Sphingomonas spermidinifaciens]